MATLKRNKQGVVGLPLQLVVILIVVVLAMPILFMWFNNYSKLGAESKIEGEMEYLILQIKEVYTQGGENARIVELDLNTNYFGRVEYIRIGGENGDLMSSFSSIRYKIMGESERTIMITDPNIPITNLTGGSVFEIGPSTNKVHIVCRTGGNLNIQNMGVVDKYVEISKIEQ
jgi:hypothetical protein